MQKKLLKTTNIKNKMKKSKFKGKKFTKDAYVIVRGYVLEDDKMKQGSRFVSFQRNAKPYLIKDIVKRKGYIEVK